MLHIKHAFSPTNRMLLPIRRLLQLFTVMLVCMFSLLPKAYAQTPTIAEFTEGMTEKSGLIPFITVAMKTKST